MDAIQLFKSIPEEALLRASISIFNAFDKIISPVTESTDGAGRLIAAKFDKLVAIEKILVAEALDKAQKKVEDSKQTPSGNTKPKIIIESIESIGQETDELLRELWANLLAQEIIAGCVHPEFPRLLRRLSSEDARILAEIAEDSSQHNFSNFIGSFLNNTLNVTMGLEFPLPQRPKFSIDHLYRLGLIESTSEPWVLSVYGEEFLKSVSDPSFSDE